MKSLVFSDCVDKLVNNIHEQNVQRGQGSISNNVRHLEMKFDSEAAAYEFYNEYNKRIGFGIRREYANKSRVDGVLTSRRFTCVDERSQPNGEPRAEIRTGCSTRIVISLDRKIEKYKVIDFIAEHNHQLNLSMFI